MIKGNESHVGNTDFELQAEGGDKFLFFIVWELQKNTPISATWCLSEMGFKSKCSILNGQVVYLKKKIKIEYCQHVTHSFDRVTYRESTGEISLYPMA